MKLKEIIISTGLIIAITATPVMALPKDVENKQDSSVSVKDETRHKGVDFIRDPISLLENKKNQIRIFLDKGRVSQQRAEEWIEQIDIRIAEIKAFDQLTLVQKKDKLISEAKARLDEAVKDGNMKQEKADAIFKKYSDRIQKWDGTGYPFFPARKYGKSPK